jgi:hypothetical protein
MSTYNEKFSIPEMIITFRTFSSKLFKDALMYLAIIYYVFIIHKITISNPKIEISYDNTYNKIIILIIFIILIISMFNNLNKLFILYRQLDDELKYQYLRSEENAAVTLRDKLNNACNQTSFVISNNFISDFLITGNKRHPTVQRLLSLFMFLILLSSPVITKIFSDITCFSTFSSFIISISFLFLIALYMLKLNYIARTAFLLKTEFIKEIYISFEILLSIFSSIARTNKNGSGGMQAFCNFIYNKDKEFTNINFLNLFDYSNHVKYLTTLITDIENKWNKLSSESQDYINNNLNVDFSHQSIKKYSHNKNDLINEYFKSLIANINTYNKYSNYYFSLRYNKINVDKCNWFLTYLFNAIFKKGKVHCA